MGRSAVRSGTLALQCTEAARMRLLNIYGIVPPVVYFIQRQVDGPIKIGSAARLSRRIGDLLCNSPEPVIVRAAAPGSLSVESWFHRRHADRRDHGEWFDAADAIVRDAHDYGDRHAGAFRAISDMKAATVSAVMSMDPFIADFYRLYRNGATQRDLCELTGLTPGVVRARLEWLRAMGFDIPYRRMYAPRGSANETWAHASVPIGRRRLIG